MIGIKVWEHLTLVPNLWKIFDELLEHFRKHVRPCFTPNQTTRPSRSGVWRSTRFCLRACITWSFLLGLRLLSRKWIADHILCHKQPRKPSDSWQCEQDKRVFGYLVFDFSKLIFSEWNFKLPSIIQYLLIQNLINKQTG